jgi:site-specific DNA-methyltransferase (adenine-specific)
LINLYNQDCMIAMKEMQDKQYDLAIVDPPYGIGIGIFQPVGGRGDFCKDNKKWDTQPLPQYFTELKRVSYHQIVWGANYFNCFSGNMGAIIWDKLQPLEDSSQCEIASYSRLMKIAKYEQRWTNFVNTKETNHPTEKPVKLYEWLLKNYAKEGDKILDTHGGSMSIAIACYNMGFDLDLYEIDKDYFEAGKARLEQHKKQLRLFEPSSPR